MNKTYTIIAQSADTDDYWTVCAEGETKDEALKNSLNELYEMICGIAPTDEQLKKFEIDGLYNVCAIEGSVKVEWF